MEMGNLAEAGETLCRISYHRLSGYWYPFLDLEQNKFRSLTCFADVVKLYDYDQYLRSAAFGALAPIELTIRTLLGFELGKVDPYAHLNNNALNKTARYGNRHAVWVERYLSTVQRSREDFVQPYRDRGEEHLPVWVAVELLD